MCWITVYMCLGSMLDVSTGQPAIPTIKINTWSTKGVCVCGTMVVGRRFREEVDQRKGFVVREGFCGAAVAGRRQPKVCVCAGRVLCAFD